MPQACAMLWSAPCLPWGLLYCSPLAKYSALQNACRCQAWSLAGSKPINIFPWLNHPEHNVLCKTGGGMYFSLQRINKLIT